MVSNVKILAKLPGFFRSLKGSEICQKPIKLSRRIKRLVLNVWGLTVDACLHEKKQLWLIPKCVYDACQSRVLSSREYDVGRKSGGKSQFGQLLISGSGQR